MRKLYKVVLATVVLAEDADDAKSYIITNDKTDHLATQEVTEINIAEELPWGWKPDHCPLDTYEHYSNPWANDSIKEILDNNREAVNQAESLSHEELLAKYKELEKRLSKLEKSHEL
jgi:hypothetical protein